MRNAWSGVMLGFGLGLALGLGSASFAKRAQASDPRASPRIRAYEQSVARTLHAVEGRDCWQTRWRHAVALLSLRDVERQEGAPESATEEQLVRVVDRCVEKASCFEERRLSSRLWDRIAESVPRSEP